MKAVCWLAIITTLLMIIALPVNAANSTYPIPHTAPAIDVMNSSGMVDWAFYMTLQRNTTDVWEFPILGFTYDIMKPFTGAFAGVSGWGGGLVYLILYGVFFIMVWRQSGKVSLPALMGCIISGAWALLLPESAVPWALMLLAAAVASQLFTFFAKE